MRLELLSEASVETTPFRRIGYGWRTMGIEMESTDFGFQPTNPKTRSAFDWARVHISLKVDDTQGQSIVMHQAPEAGYSALRKLPFAVRRMSINIVPEFPQRMSGILSGFYDYEIVPEDTDAHWEAHVLIRRPLFSRGRVATLNWIAAMPGRAITR